MKLNDNNLNEVNGGGNFIINDIQKTCPNCGKQFPASGNIDPNSGVKTETENGASLVFQFVCPHCGHRFY